MCNNDELITSRQIAAMSIDHVLSNNLLTLSLILTEIIYYMLQVFFFFSLISTCRCNYWYVDLFSSVLSVNWSNNWDQGLLHFKYCDIMYTIVFIRKYKDKSPPWNEWSISNIQSKWRGPNSQPSKKPLKGKRWRNRTVLPTMHRLLRI